jgi:hypothetical protein
MIVYVFIGVLFDRRQHTEYHSQRIRTPRTLQVKESLEAIGGTSSTSNEKNRAVAASFQITNTLMQVKIYTDSELTFCRLFFLLFFTYFYKIPLIYSNRRENRYDLTCSLSCSVESEVFVRGPEGASVVRASGKSHVIFLRCPSTSLPVPNCPLKSPPGFYAALCRLASSLYLPSRYFHWRFLYIDGMRALNRCSCNQTC